MSLILGKGVIWETCISRARGSSVTEETGDETEDETADETEDIDEDMMMEAMGMLPDRLYKAISSVTLEPL